MLQQCPNCDVQQLKLLFYNTKNFCHPDDHTTFVSSDLIINITCSIQNSIQEVKDQCRLSAGHKMLSAEHLDHSTVNLCTLQSDR
jgi:hypothetical protein